MLSAVGCGLLLWGRVSWTVGGTSHVGYSRQSDDIDYRGRRDEKTGRNRTCEATRWRSPRYLPQNLCKAARRGQHDRILFSREKQSAFPFSNLLHPNRPEMSSHMANSSIRQVVLPPDESSSAGLQEHAEGGDDTKTTRVC